MNKKNKRGQIFILAAAIISVVVMSLGAVSNYAKVLDEPEDFYDYSEDVRTEAGHVLDYEIYQYNTENELENFIGLMVQNLRDRDSDTSFMFIYGNNKGLTIENYGTDVANVATDRGVSEGEEFPDNIEPGNLNIESTISLGSTNLKVSEYYSYLGGTGAKAEFSETDLQGADNIEITILNNEYSFPITKDKQVVFLIQKEDGGEAYVSA